MLRSALAMCDNLRQLHTHAQPCDKVSALSAQINKQLQELAKLPATGNKDQVTRALRGILYFLFAFISFLHKK